MQKCVVVAILLVAGAAAAEIPDRLSVQGRLSNAGGAVDGSFDMWFTLYDASGDAVYAEFHNEVPVDDGVFQVILGDDDPLPQDLFVVGGDLSVAVQVDEQAELPSQPVASVPFALAARHAETAALADVATVAQGLSCAGCVSSEALGFEAAAKSDLTALETSIQDAVADALKTAPKRFAASGVVAPGEALTLTHGQDTADLMATAWIKTDAGLWRALPVQSDCKACGTGLDGVYEPNVDTTLAGGEYNFASINIKAGVTITVTGATPLTMRSQGAVVIAGTLALNGGNGTSGTSSGGWSQCPAPNGEGVGGAAGGGGGHAGGSSAKDYCNVQSCSGSAPNTACTCGAPGAGPGGGARGYFCGQGAGGGGGGHGAAGSTGGANSNGDAQGGAGGSAYASIDTGLLLGGSGGGSGSAGSGANAPGGGGGGGGGAVVIIAPTIQIPGSLAAHGGKGGDQTGSGDGGSGGGGAGGALWLRASAVDLTGGTITATGGAGGKASTSSPPYGGDGGPGAVGRVRIDATSIQGTSTPPFTQGDSSGLGTAAVPLVLEQTDSNTVRLVNTFGKSAELRLVVIH